MKKISDDRLEKMLTEYCEAPCERSFVFDPERAKGKAKPKIRYYRQLAAAAVFVIVGAIAVILFMNRGAQPPVISAPTASQTATEYTVATAVQPTVPTASPTAAPTEKATQKPTAAPTQRSTQSGSNATQPVDQSSPAPAQQPSEAQPTQPAVAPTQAATTPPIAPTQKPTAAPTEPPTETRPDKNDDLAAVGYDGVIIEKISAEDIGGDGLIYCRIFTEDGDLVGDGDPYSAERCAYSYERDGVVTIYYIPCDCIAMPYDGVYRFEFYDETGKILFSGEEYLIRE